MIRLLLLLSMAPNSFNFLSSFPLFLLLSFLADTGAQTITTTTHTTDGNGNPILQVCNITFTPTSDGTDVVMVETCVDSADTTTTTSTGGGGGSSTTTTDTAGGTSTSGTVSATSTSASPTATVGGAINLGTSSVLNTFSTTATQTSTGTAATTTASTTGTGTDTSTSTTASASIVAAAAVNTSLPGKSLQVLPIGLGIFAGLSVLAMIIVGVVTYERTKYRKAFRARKLAEAGSGMGYGGMAEAAPNRV
ncbi:hypothetical protein DL93DRAFT_1258201 [Clavulina sp. PMI_390]|nr:hypothetical protein DL93DRAFT_1258201 [Clavulina sp. PMI_390]